MGPAVQAAFRTTEGLRGSDGCTVAPCNRRRSASLLRGEFLPVTFAKFVPRSGTIGVTAEDRSNERGGYSWQGSCVTNRFNGRQF